MTNKIATEGQASTIGDRLLPANRINRCCTWSRARDLNCIVLNEDEVAANQLVKLDMLEAEYQNYHFEATVGIANSIYSSSLKVKIEYLLDGEVVGETIYTDTDDSRDVQTYDYEDGAAGAIQSIRFTGLTNSWAQADSDLDEVRVDNKSGVAVDPRNGTQVRFTRFAGTMNTLEGGDAYLVYLFDSL